MNSQTPRVSIQIVSWNSLTHLPSCLEALNRQTFTSWSLMIVDNASLDGTVAWLREYYPSVSLLRNMRNVGFSRAHNQAIKLTNSAYVLVMNPDIILTPEWLTTAVTYMDQHPETAVVGGKNLRYEYTPGELKEPVLTSIIDSTGLKMRRSRHTVDRGSGENDRGQFQTGPVFGISGSCALYRRSDLQAAQQPQGIFDENFFAYKEDVDLAWRLQMMGRSAVYLSTAVAYHYRAAKGDDQSGNLAIARNHRRRAAHIAYLSYRNHWLMVNKNDNARSWWLDSPWIVSYEVKKFLYLLLYQPRALKGLFTAIQWCLTGRNKQLKHIPARATDLRWRQWLT